MLLHSVLLTMVLLGLTACGPKLEVKGTVFVRPFSAQSDANETPEVLSSLLLETLLFSTHTQVLGNLHGSSTLKPGMPCPEADYELVGRLESVGRFLNSTPGTSIHKSSASKQLTIKIDLLLQECSGNVVRHYTVMERNVDPLKLYVKVANSITEGLGVLSRE